MQTVKKEIIGRSGNTAVDLINQTHSQHFRQTDSVRLSLLLVLYFEKAAA